MFILAWAVFGVVFTVMVALSVGAIYFSKEPSSSEPERNLLNSKNKGGIK